MAIEYAGSRAEGARSRRVDAADIPGVLRRIDWLLLGGVAGLVAYGLWAIAGITRTQVKHDPTYYLTRQGGYVAVGAVGLVVALLVDPDAVRRRWRGIYGGTVALMLLVFAVGRVTRHSKRWLDLGFFKFQPSEFGKLLFVLAIAGFLAERSRRINDWRTTLASVGLAAVPIALVFKQPDLGTALVYAAALFALLFVCGARWTHIATLAGGAAFAAVAVLWLLPIVGIHPLEQYQVDRLTTFFNPSKDPRGATYNSRQSMTAIGAGGLRGRGPQGSTQTNLGLLPEAPTDFAFAALAEQRGFVGATVLLLLYLLVVWRGLRVVTLAPDLYGAVVAGGIIFALLFQIFVNVGMTMAIAPITGIPLPFVSVGGSSMIANLIAVGVLLAIAARGRAVADRRR
jgi:rod shape determining protein RodA